MLARLASLAVAALALTASSASAQQAAIYGAGLEAWTGCWSAEQTLTPAGVVRLVCITPTADVNVADVATFDGSTVVRETIDATSRPRTLQAPGCTGTRRTTWSRDSRRLFVNTSGVCRGVPLATAAIVSISSAGEWVQVEGSALGGASRVRVARYRDVGVPAGLPPDVATSLRRNALARESTRAAFGAPVHLDDVIEALGIAQPDVVAAWVHERAQQFDVTQADLARVDLTGFPRVAEALTAIADSTAALARAADSASYAAYAMNQQASEFYDDFVPLMYWGAGYGASFAARRGGVHGGHGRGGAPPAASGGTVRLGRPRP